MPFVWLFALLVLLVGNGCANRERQADSSSVTLVAEGYLRKSRRPQPLDKRIGLLLGAAHISWKESGEGGSHDRARQIYNAATAELAVLLMEAPSNATISVRGLAAGYRVRLASGNRKQGIWDPRFLPRSCYPAPRRWRPCAKSSTPRASADSCGHLQGRRPGQVGLAARGRFRASHSHS